MLNLTPEAQAAWERLWSAKCPGEYHHLTTEGPPCCLAYYTRAPIPDCGGTKLRWPQLSRPCPDAAVSPALHVSTARSPCNLCGGRGRIAVEPTEKVLLSLARAERIYLSMDSVGNADADDGRPHRKYCENDPRSAGILALAEALLGVKDG